VTPPVVAGAAPLLPPAEELCCTAPAPWAAPTTAPWAGAGAGTVEALKASFSRRSAAVPTTFAPSPTVGTAPVVPPYAGAIVGAGAGPVEGKVEVAFEPLMGLEPLMVLEPFAKDS